MPETKSNAGMTILIIVIIAALIGAGFYYFKNDPTVDENTEDEVTEDKITDDEASEDETANDEATAEDDANEETSDESEITELKFDGCGAVNKYASEPWFDDLETKYAAGDYMEDTINAPYGEGCLSLDETLFIFIPSDFAQAEGCGRIFKYDTENSVLSEAAGDYCAKEFGSRVGNYVEFNGLQFDDICTQYEGKYYFEENTVEVETNAC